MKGKVRKILLVPYTFVLMNWAAVAGLYYYARGARDAWDPAGARNS